MNHFATLFDKNYASRGKVMWDSLLQHHNPSNAQLFVLALDEKAYSICQLWQQTQPILLEEIEIHFPKLLEAKANRTFVSYIFTLSAFLPLFILEKFPQINRITTLDADLLFLNSPEKVLSELGDSKIGITPHHFPQELKDKEIYGKYNVSFQSFPNNPTGIQCLQQWADDCFGFCGDYLDEQGRFADQKYLDKWTSLFPEVVEFPKTVGLAPWNIKIANLYFKENQWRSDFGPPVFYHFHHFRIKTPHRISTGLYQFGYAKHKPSVIKLYKLYWRKLNQTGKTIDTGITRIASAVNTTTKAKFVELSHETSYFKWGAFYLAVDLRFITIPLLNIYRKINGKHYIS